MDQYLDPGILENILQHYYSQKTTEQLFYRVKSIYIFFLNRLKREILSQQVCSYLWNLVIVFVASISVIKSHLLVVQKYAEVWFPERTFWPPASADREEAQENIVSNNFIHNFNINS